MRALRLFLPFGLLVALVFSSAAYAVHNTDQHSLNTTKLFQQPYPTIPGQNTTNSDIAFWGNRAYVGNYSGIRIYDIANPASPVLLGDFRCLGAQNDAAVWGGTLMFTATDQAQTGPDCGATNTASDNPAGWEGVRIYDVSNPATVRQIGSVYSDCGAHTITLNPVSVSMLHLWVSSYPLAPGPSCGPVRGPERGRHPHHGVIQIIEVPIANPAAAREIAEPQIVYPGDPDNAFNPAEHDLDLLTMRACHDIQIHVPLRIAAAACAEQGQLWRIGADGMPDTQNPIWVVDEVTDSDGPGGGDVQVDFWHSATFSWDGKYVNFIDESFGSGCPVVTGAGLGPDSAEVPSDSGWMFFYDRATGQQLSRMMMPRPDTASGAYCSAHLGNVAPTIGQYHLINAWYTGGMDVVDFTNPRVPVEIAHYDNAPGGSAGSFNWSAYWYETNPGDNDGYWIWGNDILDGFQVFRTAVQATDIALTRLNPQTQEDLIRCRVRVTPGSLRATQRRTLTATVSILPGVAIVPGQTVGNVPIRFRGPGINVSTRTNDAGAARVSGVTAARRGTLTVSVPDVPNMLGCSARVRVAAAPRPPRGGGVRGGGAGGGVGLTGRPTR
jgi:LVIVD repeat